MGPLLDDSGMCYEVGFVRPLSHGLQWGRCSMTAECGIDPHSREVHETASMGPLLDDSGMATAALGVVVHYGKLQWGRCSMTAECTPVAAIVVVPLQLQWGRCSMTAECR